LCTNQGGGSVQVLGALDQQLEIMIKAVDGVSIVGLFACHARAGGAQSLFQFRDAPSLLDYISDEVLMPTTERGEPITMKDRADE
jgi:hypothetical protein